MRIASMMAIVVLATATSLAAAQASAEEYRATGDFDQACPGEKSEVQTLSGQDDVLLTPEDASNTTLTVCVPNDSPGNVLVQWGADRTWTNSGNLRNGCAVLQGVRSVKARAVTTNDLNEATYYTCAQ